MRRPTNTPSIALRLLPAMTWSAARTRTPDPSAAERLAEACSVLVDAAQHGLRGTWGMTSWDPRPLDRLTGKRASQP